MNTLYSHFCQTY